MDLIKEIVCDDIYNIIEDYLKQVVVFPKKYLVRNARENVYITYITINSLIYLDSINSSCVKRWYTSFRYGNTIWEKTIDTNPYNNDIFKITGLYGLHFKFYSERLVNVTKNYIIYIENKDINIFGDDTLHSDIIDYYFKNTSIIPDSLIDEDGSRRVVGNASSISSIKFIEEKKKNNCIRINFRNKIIDY